MWNKRYNLIINFTKGNAVTYRNCKVMPREADENAIAFSSENKIYIIPFSNVLSIILEEFSETGEK